MAVAPAGTKKKAEKSPTIRFFGAVFSCVFLPLPCMFCSLRRSAARKHYLKMLQTICFYDIICVCAVCTRNANILLTERKWNNNVQMQAKNTMPRKLGKKPKKAPFWEPTCLQKSTPEASGSALDASCARLPRQELSKSALGGLQWRKKSFKSAPGENSNEIGKKQPSGPHWSAVLARPVKAYPGGFRPGKTRLKNLKHARHRKRWSAD